MLVNGAEKLLRGLADNGVTACFANPGTTEMHLVAALDTEPRIRPVLGLFEGVVTGAADGYGRMSDVPAMTILHLGPGLANGLANLHNARRANTPMVNVVGDHTTWHLAADAPLTSDIPSLARPMSAWVHTVSSADNLASDGIDALSAAMSAPGGVATLIVPQDTTWDEVDESAPIPTPSPVGFGEVPPNQIESMVDELRRLGDAAVLVLGSNARREAGLKAAAQIQAATNARVVVAGMASRVERGAHVPDFPSIPYFPEQAVPFLADVKLMILVGTTEPVHFFGNPGQPSHPRPTDALLVSLATPSEDAESALVGLAAALDAPPVAVPEHAAPQMPSGSSLGPAELGAALALLQPEGAIVVDESISSGAAYSAMATSAPPHDVLHLTGGAIGQGLPAAVGAAIACPDRRVIALQADGSAMYTLQSLWTMARESLDISIVLLANKNYRILQIELMRAGINEPGPSSYGLTDLERPHIDWVALATGMGVLGRRARSADELVDALRESLNTSGPSLVEVWL